MACTVVCPRADCCLRFRLTLTDFCRCAGLSKIFGRLRVRRFLLASSSTVSVLDLPVVL
eukprot:COSAG01_NODE_14362_length_1463_cov_6.917889_1_plen_58_part_10